MKNYIVSLILRMSDDIKLLTVKAIANNNDEALGIALKDQSVLELYEKGYTLSTWECAYITFEISLVYKEYYNRKYIVPLEQSLIFDAFSFIKNFEYFKYN